jgi:tetratricopeptide (TPR) repeat protein
MLQDYKTSMDLYKNLLPRYSKVFGEQFIETLNLKNYLAGCYFESGMYDEAYELYHKITTTFKTQTGEFSNITVMTKYFSGLCLSFKDKVSKEVIDIYEYLISIKDKFQNKEYILKKISFLEMRKYLADYYCFTKKNYDKSLNIYKEILTSNEYKNDNYREEYLWIEDRIAYCYMNLGKYENAIDKYRFLLKQLLKTDGDWIKRFNCNIDICKENLKIIYSSLNIKYTKILKDDLSENSKGKEIYRCVSLSSVRLKVLIEKYKKYIGVDKIYNDINTILESNNKVLKTFTTYK